MKVFALVIDHATNTTVSVHRTRNGAVAVLREYVTDYWKQDMRNVPMPTDHDEAVDIFFENVEDEGYFIEECTLED